MNTGNDFFDSLCQISGSEISNKINSGMKEQQAMLEVAQLIACYLDAITSVLIGRDDGIKSINPNLILAFIAEQYKK